MTRLAPLLLALALACQAPSDRAREPLTEGDVRAFAAELARDLGERGPAAWADWFSEDPRFFMASDGRLAFDGRDQAEAFLADFAPRVVCLELAWSELRVEPVAPGLAMMAAEYDEVLLEGDGTRRTFRGYFTGLVERTPVGLRLRHAHWSMLPDGDRD